MKDVRRKLYVATISVKCYRQGRNFNHYCQMSPYGTTTDIYIYICTCTTYIYIYNKCRFCLSLLSHSLSPLFLSLANRCRYCPSSSLYLPLSRATVPSPSIYSPSQFAARFNELLRSRTLVFVPGDASEALILFLPQSENPKLPVWRLNMFVIMIRYTIENENFMLYRITSL